MSPIVRNASHSLTTRRCALGVIALAVVCVSRAALADASSPYHLADQASAGQHFGMVAQGVQKRVLDLKQRELTFPLANAPANPIFVFSIGRQEAPKKGTPMEGTVRFEVLLKRPSGETTELYNRELDHPGWVDERIDLSGVDLQGAELVLRKRMTAGPLGLFFLSGWGDPVLLPRDTQKRSSVILISLDTLRGDHVGAYGYNNARTPALDAFAKSGVLYERAYSPSMWTLPSHHSLFFGLYPAKLPKDAPKARPVSVAPGAEPQPIAEIMQDAGYLTAGFTGGGFMSTYWNFPRGFDTYYMFKQPDGGEGTCADSRFDGSEVFARATTWLQERARGPFFMFVHTYDIHDRCPFRGPNLGPFDSWPDPGPQGRAELIGYYDDLVAKTDVRVGALLRELDALGLSETTLVVITADHGEGFWEHGFHGHGCPWKPYEELVRVPLMLRYPKHVPAGVRVATPVPLVDVAPTILNLMGLPQPKWMPGRVLPGIDPNRPTPPAPLYVQCDDMLAVIDGRDKLITTQNGRVPDEVYNLVADPGEKTNLAGKGTPPEAALRELAAQYWRESGGLVDERQAIDNLDPNTRERLRALGYLK